MKIIECIPSTCVESPLRHIRTVNNTLFQVFEDDVINT